MDDPPAPPPKTPAQLAREERQAAALRANLRRRKAQARARAEAAPVPPAEDADEQP